MNENELYFKILFTENKHNRYRFETYKIDKNKFNDYKKYFDENIVNKLNVNIEYTVEDIYKLFEKNIPEFKDLFDYLTYRDVFNNYTEWIIMLKKILKLLNITDCTTLVKISNIGKYLNLKSNVDNDEEQNINELHTALINIFSEIGVIAKDKSDKFINPSFAKIFGFDNNIISNYKTKKIITTESDINFNEFFPGKSNGRIIRYLKIYKSMPNKDNYNKNDFKKELINTGFVEYRKKEIYYKKEHLDELKEWIIDKILN